MTREDAKRKVRALLNTAAAGSGATDPERATAARIANRLIAQYDLDTPEPRRAPGVTITVNATDFSFGFDEESLRTSIDDVLREYIWRPKEDLLRDKQNLFRDILKGVKR